ncbi:kelch domain-containing protein 3 [Lingula anatina]|uniref:Kelch domain-containing protein 3 n=1 Tax=Lingula anatina TaxID=7574 RepID=A0A1S3H7X3_LINAN|nr:kelch domain-containing protein 3 [Lingula anatina]XP_013382216.1 kelch domain-containing protein 3 [Lingula anatina]XP_013382218.1 kelch domain-containing protein 3 [Lingula anatina]|eukprot:XP_013382215.1 kelch domain-containing protein 3 [Lingula anatina]
MPWWTVHLEGGPRRVNHAAVNLKDEIYSFGGYCTGEDYETRRPMDIHVLNTVAYQWKKLPLPRPDDPQSKITPYQRYGHTAVAFNDCAYLWGGRNDSDGACNILYCYDPSTGKWSKPKTGGETPGARDGHAACVIGNRMYIFGGYEEEVYRFSNDIHCLDLSTFIWSLLHTWGTPARWRDFHSATGIGHFMYIFGGRGDRGGPYHTNNEVYCNQMQIFNTQDNTWYEPSCTGDIPSPGRRSHSAFVYKNKLYLFGGYNGLVDEHFSDLYKFDPDTCHWSLVKCIGDGPCARRRQCCCVVGDRLFLFGGTSPNPEFDEEEMVNTEFELMDHSDLYVLDFVPSLKTLCALIALKSQIDTSCLPEDIRWELLAMTTNSSISRPQNTNG